MKSWHFDLLKLETVKKTSIPRKKTNGNKLEKFQRIILSLSKKIAKSFKRGYFFD